ncbi:MAG: site-specific DNA-methyltransferase [Anaerolineaceae bacterium]|nr:site-specific DNA-methyltransferase [Anaerolineaceae bacterium]
MTHKLNGNLPPFEDIDESELAEYDARSLKELSVLANPDDWSDISEIQAKNWRDYDDIVTNSLWIIGSRSRDGVHSGQYHGNFVPQIPYQAIRRFTKPGDVVLDTFLGSGTTLIESRRLGRHGIGIELVDSIAQGAAQLIEAEANPHQTWQDVITGSSADPATIAQIRATLAAKGQDNVQLLIMHPPYHDIIQFSDHPADLSNQQTVPAFIDAFKQVVYRTYDLLEQNRFLVVVIGDKYSHKEWIPLGFLTMEAVRSVGYSLKSIVVKNMEGNRAKRNLQNLWRQRAFRGNYYIFKHEYVLFFQKTEKVIEQLEVVTDFVRRIDAREERELIQANSFASGEALKSYFKAGLPYSSISTPRLLVLKHRGRIRAVVINLTEVKLTYAVENELQDLIDALPDSVIDVSVIADHEHKNRLEDIPGLAQVYTPDEPSLEKLAHALYMLRKALEPGPRAGRTAAVTFAADLNETLKTHFEPGVDYEWPEQSRGIGFKCLKIDPHQSFDDTSNGEPNFRIGLEIKWIGGYEQEKALQIRGRYFNRTFTLVAVVGYNDHEWQTTIHDHGHFADYYLLLNKADQKSLADIIQTRPLLRACGQTALAETDQSLVAFLRSQQAD